MTKKKVSSSDERRNNADQRILVHSPSLLPSIKSNKLFAISAKLLLLTPPKLAEWLPLIHGYTFPSYNIRSHW